MLDVFRAASWVVKLTAAGEEANRPHGLNSTLTVGKIWCFPPRYVWRKTFGYCWRMYFKVLAGPAGAFAQEYTVMRNTLSNNKLYDHEKASRYHISDLTVP